MTVIRIEPGSEDEVSTFFRLIARTTETSIDKTTTLESIQETIYR